MFYFTITFIALAAICDAARISLNDDDGIVGGDPIDIKQAPYIVSLQYSGSHFCGASIIANDIILTARHCIQPGLTDSMTVRAGSTYKSKDGQVIKVKSTKSNVNSDVAILRLEKPLEISDSVKVIMMASTDDKLNDGDLCAVSGWGHTDPWFDRVERSEMLRQVKVPFVNTEKCSEMYGQDIGDDEICAGFDEGGKDSCQGDSGGPLVYEDKLFGVVSWGAGCARPNKPGVYASVPFSRKWIDENSKLL